jgi:hypothetical protein
LELLSRPFQGFPFTHAVSLEFGSQSASLIYRMLVLQLIPPGGFWSMGLKPLNFIQPDCEVTPLSIAVRNARFRLVVVI